MVKRWIGGAAPNSAKSAADLGTAAGEAPAGAAVVAAADFAIGAGTEITRVDEYSF